MADMKLELIPLPVTDLDASKAFYVDTVGFHCDHDISPNENFRVIQLTPPGSACSIAIGTGISSATPGSVKGIHLVVDDLNATREELAARGLETSDIQDMGGVLYSYFSDPDDNTWALQEIPAHFKER